jgi:hypothetical protein
VDPYRQNLQRVYLEVLNDKVNGRQAAASQSRALARSELRALDVAVRAAIPRTTDRSTRAHLQDVRDQIGRILDPKFAPAPTPQIVIPILTAADGENCWIDYAIRLDTDAGAANHDAGVAQP